MNNQPSKPLQLAILSGIVAASLMWLGPMLDRPLWVDELHTSWVVSTSWSELSERARAGNQSVLYFAFLKMWIQVWGQYEWSLRLPSLIAWIVGLLSLSLWLLRSNRNPGLIGCIPVVGWCLSILVDRMQFFYAVEARSYAIVQLLNLWSWMLVAEIVQNHRPPSQNENYCPGRRHWYFWAICAGLMVAVHITSGLSLAFQTIVLVAVVLLRKQVSLSNVVCLMFVIGSGVWQLFANQTAWNRRQQWSTFAGDDSWGSLLSMFPFVQIALPTLASLFVLKIWQRLFATESKLLPSDNQGLPSRAIGVWLSAAIGPVVLAWSLTHFQIAPLMHYRFVIVAALPIYLCFAQLSAMLAGWLRHAAVLLTWLWMIFSQGLLELPLEQWRTERQENWRGASEFIARQFSADSQTLWCYSGLIEGVDVELPLTEDQNRYLSYPLRGIHQILNLGVPVEPKSLIADRKAWLRQVEEQARSDGHGQIWIVYRGPAERLERDLVSSGLSKFKLIQQVHPFDRVSVVGLDLSNQP
ncbi:MAG: hypothetical protein U0930_00585 [Pirellulales bacterium]